MENLKNFAKFFGTKQGLAGQRVVSDGDGRRTPHTTPRPGIQPRCTTCCHCCSQNVLLAATPNANPYKRKDGHARRTWNRIWADKSSCQPPCTNAADTAALLGSPSMSIYHWRWRSGKHSGSDAAPIECRPRWVALSFQPRDGRPGLCAFLSRVIHARFCGTGTSWDGVPPRFWLRLPAGTGRCSLVRLCRLCQTPFVRRLKRQLPTCTGTPYVQLTILCHREMPCLDYEKLY